METKTITIESLVDAPIEKVWECFSKPERMIHWNFASVDWHTVKADNDLCVAREFFISNDRRRKVALVLNLKASMM